MKKLFKGISALALVSLIAVQNASAVFATDVTAMQTDVITNLELVITSVMAIMMIGLGFHYARVLYSKLKGVK